MGFNSSMLNPIDHLVEFHTYIVKPCTIRGSGRGDAAVRGVDLSKSLTENIYRMDYAEAL